MQSTLSSKVGVTWEYLVDPTPEELAELVRTVDMLPLDAEFIAQPYHRPEITIRSHYLLLLIQVPVFNKQSRVTSGAPLYAIVTKNTLWIVTYTDIPVLEGMWQEFEESEDRREDYFTDGPLGLALHIVASLFGSAFNKLERLHKHINIAEDAVFQGNERKMVEEVSILKRDTLDFRKTVRSQRMLFAQVPDHAFFSPELGSQWQRMHGQMNKLWEFLESLFESVKELGETNQNLLQHKENELLRILTYYSVISIPAFLLLTPLDPFAAGASLGVKIFFWGLVVFLLGLLVFILLRFRGKRVL